SGWLRQRASLRRKPSSPASRSRTAEAKLVPFRLRGRRPACSWRSAPTLLISRPGPGEALMSVTPVIGPLVFVDIDTQRDFLEPNGALAIDGAAAIVPNLARLTQFARERGILVLATA